MKPSKRQAAEKKASHQLLQEKGLRITPLRAAILDQFIDSEAALSQAELIGRMGGGEEVDRVTVYRNLQQLIKSGLVHQTEPNCYVYCDHVCHTHPHLILFCQRCQKFRELQDHRLVEGLMNQLESLRFFSRHEPIMVRGVCKSCQA